MDGDRLPNREVLKSGPTIDGRGSGVVSGIEIAAGSAVASFGATGRLSHPTRHSLQVSEWEHILLAPPLLRYVNHSCVPNTFFDVGRWLLVALSPVAPGEELTIFYPATEWEMKFPFTCRCGCDQCVGWIGGAAVLGGEALDGHAVSGHVRLLAERRRAIGPSAGSAGGRL